MIARPFRIVVLASALCIALPSPAAGIRSAEPTAVRPARAKPAADESAPAGAPLTVAQAREAQALFGFDEAIPMIIEMAFKEQPEYASITDRQRECAIREASPAMYAVFDRAFIELFGDTSILDGWRAFSKTAGGKRFIDDMRASAALKVKGQPVEDASSTIARMNQAEKDDIRAFWATRAATVLDKEFPNMDMTPEAKAAVRARIQQTCGVALSNP